MTPDRLPGFGPDGKGSRRAFLRASAMTAAGSAAAACRPNKVVVVEVTKEVPVAETVVVEEVVVERTVPAIEAAAPTSTPVPEVTVPALTTGQERLRALLENSPNLVVLNEQDIALLREEGERGDLARSRFAALRIASDNAVFEGQLTADGNTNTIINAQARVLLGGQDGPVWILEVNRTAHVEARFQEGDLLVPVNRSASAQEGRLIIWDADQIAANEASVAELSRVTNVDTDNPVVINRDGDRVFFDVERGEVLYDPIAEPTPIPEVPMPEDILRVEGLDIRYNRDRLRWEYFNHANICVAYWDESKKWVEPHEEVRTGTKFLDMSLILADANASLRGTAEIMAGGEIVFALPLVGASPEGRIWFHDGQICFGNFPEGTQFVSPFAGAIFDWAPHESTPTDDYIEVDYGGINGEPRVLLCLNTAQQQHLPGQSESLIIAGGRRLVTITNPTAVRPHGRYFREGFGAQLTVGVSDADFQHIPLSLENLLRDPETGLFLAY